MRSFLVAIVGLSVSACSLVLGLPSSSTLATDDASAETNDAGPLGDGGSLDAAGSDGATRIDASPCAADTQSDDDNNCGVCGRSCKGTTCQGGRCEVSTLAASNEPSGIAVRGGYVYWTETYLESVYRVATSGGAREPIAESLPDELGAAIALDDTRVYFLHNTSGVDDVFTCPLTGCGVSAPTKLFGGFADMNDLALLGGYVYVARYYKSTQGELLIAPTTGDAGSPFRTGIPQFVAAAGDKIAYLGASEARFATPGTSGGDSYLGQVVGDPSSIATDGTIAAWTEVLTDGGGAVSLWDSNVKVLARGARPSDVIIDGDYVYWVNFGVANTAGGVFACKKAGCPPEGPIAVSVALPYPFALASDAEFIYVTVRGASGGSIVKVAKL